MKKKSIYQIKLEGEILRQKTDEELLLKAQILKKRATQSKIVLDDLLVELFSLVQEVSFRKIGLRHFDSQLLAGMYLHEGKIVEMKTGEGKTLASTLPVALNALTKKGVHIVTVNDYLAERDKNWMGKIYQGLDLSVGLIKSGNNFFEKKKNYDCDITYLTNSELVFDYLRDSSALQSNELVQRPFNYCVIDEIDSILIDEARTPLILSMPEGETNRKKLFLAKTIANFLEKEIHFELDEKRREINFTEKGYQEVKEKLGKETLYDLEDPWILEILNALKAKHIFKRNKDYILLKNKIVIVDEFTGRVMEDRRWSLGIHEAIEVKENVEIGNITKTKISMTYQNFFPLYPKLSGMTGTAKTAEKEFKDIYGLDVIVLPTAKSMIRNDLADFVYQTEFSKWKAVLIKAKECFQKGQPILIGTSNVEKSEFLSQLFQSSNIPHRVLNAKPENISQESEIVAQAGEPYAVTIATNMAGRGTDIILGGNPSFKVKQVIKDLIIDNPFFRNQREIQEDQEIEKKSIEFFENEKILTILKNFNNIENIENIEKHQKELIILLQQIWKEYVKKNNNNFEKLEIEIANLPYSLDNCFPSLKNFYEYLYDKIFLLWEKQNNKVKNLGGLFVLGTERHETRRIDNQLRGRAGRQGDPGFSQFFVSLDDELIKIFGGDSIRRWLTYLMTDNDVPLESNFLTQSLEKAQEKIEIYNYEIRKNVFQYDEIINSQRKQLFFLRKEILNSNLYNELSLRYSELTFDMEQEKQKNIASKTIFDIFEKKKQINYKSFFFKFEKFFPYFNQRLFEKKDNSYELEMYKEIWISIDFRFASGNVYQNGFFKNTQNQTLLSLIDFYWTEHIERMEYIRDTINWRSYGQQNPLIEYNSEAFLSYKFMLQQVRLSMLYYFLENPILNKN
jgi:preprotein translocase subunit SecA